MENQNSNKEIYSALVKATNELENPKNSVDNTYFKSKYVPLSDILSIAKPVLKKHGLAVIQTPYVMYETIQNIGKNGQTYPAEIGVVKVTTTLIHESGETLEFPPMIFKASGNTPQNIGSAITYGRRYSLSSILGIAGKEEDDDGNNAVGNSQQNYNQSNQYNNYQQPSGQPNSQQQQQPSNNQANSNVDLKSYEAVVTKKTEGKSGKGNPFIELVLEKDGKFLTTIAKDQKVIEVAKGLEEGSIANFKILSAQGFHFIEGIEVQEAKAE